MNITLFNKKYWVRRFKEPQNIRGYITADHEDFVASLHIHPMGSDAMLALPEGERKMKHLEGHGTDVLIPASRATCCTTWVTGTSVPPPSRGIIRCCRT